jgi:signal transduction histidine kinase
MMKLFTSFFSLFRGGHPAVAATHARHPGMTEKYPRRLMLGLWWLVLILVLFFLMPGTSVSLIDFSQRALCLLLVAGVSGLLLRQEKRFSRQITEERDIANRLLAVNRGLLTLELDTLLQRLVDEVMRLFPCRGAALLLLNAGQDKVERIVTAGQMSAAAIDDLQVSLTKGVFREALIQGAIVFNSPQEIQTRLHALQMKEYVRQNLLIAGIHRHQRMGFLVLADKGGGKGFYDADVQMLTTVAEQAAMAIENARMLREARAAESERRGLLRALISAQEQERKHVAEEWHDRLGAKLFQMLRDFRACQELIVQRVPEGKERFEQLAAEIDAMAALVRGFTNELHPLVLDDFGFVAALHEYVAGLHEQEPFRVTVRAEEVDGQLPTEANLTLFRITQEALLNIRKHARARHVQIAFVQEHSGVSLMIKDDGQGFNPERPLQGHYGLLYMRERAEACGGKFRVVSARGQGTEIRVDFPGGERSVVHLSRREHPV